MSESLSIDDTLEENCYALFSSLLNWFSFARIYVWDVTYNSEDCVQSYLIQVLFVHVQSKGTYCWKLATANITFLCFFKLLLKVGLVSEKCLLLHICILHLFVGLAALLWYRFSCWLSVKHQSSHPLLHR